MNRIFLLIILALAAGLFSGACSSPSSQPGNQTQTFPLEIAVAGETQQFTIDNNGKLRSNVAVKSEDDKLRMTADYGTVLRDMDGKPLTAMTVAVDAAPPPAPEDAYILGQVYEMTPAGATFDPFLRLSLSYQEEKRPLGTGLNALNIGYHEDGGWQRLRYKNMDTTAGRIETTVQGSLRFAILVEKSAITSALPVVGTQIGNLAPDFSFELSGGQTSSLRALQGKPVVLNFWATWCGPCRIEIPFLQMAYKEWAGKGLVMLAVNTGESQEKVQAFVRANNMSLPVVFDSQNEISQKYRINAIPTTYFIGKNGIIEKVKIGAFTSKAEIDDNLRLIMP